MAARRKHDLSKRQHSRPSSRWCTRASTVYYGCSTLFYAQLSSQNVLYRCHLRPPLPPPVSTFFFSDIKTEVLPTAVTGLATGAIVPKDKASLTCYETVGYKWTLWGRVRVQKRRTCTTAVQDGYFHLGTMTPLRFTETTRW